MIVTRDSIVVLLHEQAMEFYRMLDDPHWLGLARRYWLEIERRGYMTDLPNTDPLEY